MKMLRTGACDPWHYQTLLDVSGEGKVTARAEHCRR